MVGAGHHIRILHLEDGPGRSQRRAALPHLDDAGVPRGRHGAGPEVRAHEDRIRVDPGDLTLGFCELEAVLHEGLGFHIEFPHHAGIGSAPRQRNQTAAMVGLEELGAMEHPAFLLGLSEGIDIQHHIPLGIGLPVFIQRRAPPNAARILGVLPEVVEPGAPAVHVGDLGVGIHDPADLGFQFLEALRAHQFLFRCGIAGLHPGHGLFARDILQPDIGVCGQFRLRGRFRLRPVQSNHRRSRQDQRHPTHGHPRFPSTSIPRRRPAQALWL